MSDDDNDENGDGTQTWQPSLDGFLKYLVDSKLIFSTVEQIVDESSDVACKIPPAFSLPDCLYFVHTKTRVCMIMLVTNKVSVTVDTLLVLPTYGKTEK